MPITVNCQCGAIYRVADQYAGKRTRCKKCSAILDIPTPLEPVAVEETTEQAQAAQPPVAVDPTPTAAPEAEQPQENAAEEPVAAQWSESAHHESSEAEDAPAPPQQEWSDPEQEPTPAVEQQWSGEEQAVAAEQEWPAPAQQQWSDSGEQESAEQGSVPPQPIGYASAPVGTSRSSGSMLIVGLTVGGLVIVALVVAGIFFFRSSAPVKPAMPINAGPATAMPGSNQNMTTPDATTDPGSNLAGFNQALAQAIENRMQALEALKQAKPDLSKVDTLDDAHRKLKRTMLNLSVELTSEEAASVDAEQKRRLVDVEFEVTTLRAQVQRPDLPKPESETPPPTTSQTPPNAQ